MSFIKPKTMDLGTSKHKLDLALKSMGFNFWNYSLDLNLKGLPFYNKL
jgi:hypothetical protein